MNPCASKLSQTSAKRSLGRLNRGRHGGSAVLIVLILLSIMGVLVVSNSVVLRRLKIELQLLEEKQRKALEARLSLSSGEHRIAKQAQVDGSVSPAESAR